MHTRCGGYLYLLYSGTMSSTRVFLKDSTRKRIIVMALLLVFIGTFSVISIPKQAGAFPWGGRFNTVIKCWNDVTWVQVGPPRGGTFIWDPTVTETYAYGPPQHAGQYGLGLAAPPYWCVITPTPVNLKYGIIMTMLGTSR